MATDFGRALLQLYGDVQKARDTSSYARMVATWLDVDTPPSEAACDAADLAYVAAETAVTNARNAARADVRTKWLTQINGSTGTGISKIVADAIVTFGDGFRTATNPPTLTEYRQTINATLTVLDALPNPIKTSYDRERLALGLPANAAGATEATCQAMHRHISGWLGRAAGLVALSQIAGIED